VDAARVTTRCGAVWRTCPACGTLAALAPDAKVCDTCVAEMPVPVRAHRSTVAAVSAPAVTAVRDLYAGVPSDVVRVAALVEIAAAAANLARTVVKLRHLDPALVAPHVKDVTDLHAVLGRGRWLPTMIRYVPAPARLARDTSPSVLAEGA
jgi:hypothetical protein